MKSSHKNYEPMVYYYNQPFPKNKYWRPVSLLTLDHQRKCLTPRNKRPWIQETTLDPFTQLKVHPGATDAIIWGKVMVKALGWWNWKYPSFPVLSHHQDNIIKCLGSGGFLKTFSCRYYSWGEQRQTLDLLVRCFQKVPKIFSKWWFFFMVIDHSRKF